MKLYRKEDSRLKRPFIAAGAVTGVLASGWYLYRSMRSETLLGAATVPDPIWTRFVNVALILFACIYVANVMRRLVELMMKRKG
jgi:hypothetical protein